MDICFITDSNYIVATMTAIKSLIFSNKKEKLSVFILGYKITEDEYKQILKLKTKNAEIIIMDVSDKIIDMGKENMYVTKSALIKFYLPIIFSDKDRILYLDGDVLVKTSISDFYASAFDNTYAVVIKDMLATKEGFGKSLELENYFNSGVMLLNLKKMRDDNITEKLIDYKINQDKGPFMDQNTLNKVLNYRVKYTSPKYNYQLYNLLEFSDDEIMNFYDITCEELKDIRKLNTILHITNIYKPWLYPNHPGFKEFIGYFRKLPNCKYKKLTIKKLFGNNYGMIIKYHLRGNILISKLIDMYEKVKYSR